jgi:hypothetical protein
VPSQHVGTRSSSPAQTLHIKSTAAEYILSDFAMFGDWLSPIFEFIQYKSESVT